MSRWRPGEADRLYRAMQETKEEPESALMSKIRAYCLRNGYPAQFFPTSRKLSPFLTPGIPDCIIALPAGRTLWLELKSKRGCLSDPQKQVRQQLLHLGHEWHKVKTFKAFKELVANRGVA